MIARQSVLIWLVVGGIVLAVSTQPGTRADATAGLGSSAQEKKPVQLTKTHAGWRQVACLDCHEVRTLERTHQATDRRPPACGRCHGFNGAPHADHAIRINPCTNCHAMVEHAARFDSPGDCIGCHHHPQSPTGRIAPASAGR